MSRADDVLAECAARPDDDGPRLVWADLVGGERGELVVIQCELARGNVTPELRARERELLDQHGVAWAGDVRPLAWQWSYRRGFIEAVWLRDEEVAVAALAQWPLVSSVTIEWTRWLDRLAAYPHVRALGILQWPAPDDPRLAQITRLKAFSAWSLIGDVPQYFEDVRDLIARTQLEQLHLRGHTLRAHQLATLLDASPRLVALELTDASDLMPEIVKRPFRALRLGRVHYRDLALLPGSVAAQTLERLSFDLLGDAPLLADVLAACPRLRVVERRADYGGHDELLHESPDALIGLGPPCFETTPPACLLRVDTGEIFEIGPRPIYDDVVLGRSIANAVILHSPTIARRHARLTWRDAHHVLQDMGSTNGVVVAGARVDRVVLRDGDSFALGAITLRYFVGDGCRQRAR